MSDTKTVNKRRKRVDPYSSSSNTNTVIREYIHGIYFNNTTHDKELLSTKVNKYNLQMLDKLKELNRQFRSLIIVYGITLKLIQEHKEHDYGDSKNLWRLMQAQSGTIKFNKILRSALRKYAVDKQKIYDNIRMDIDRQVDRVGRNKQLILDMFRDYGMNNLTDIVEQDTGLDIFEHASKFLDEKQADVIIVNDDDLDAFYDKAKDEYVIWLKELASRYGVDIFEDVSQSIKDHRKRKEETIQKIKQQNKDNKEAAKRDRILQKLTTDGFYIQKDLESSADIIEQHSKGHKLGYVALRDLRNKLKPFEDCVYYIAMSSNGAIRYLSEDFKPAASLRNAKFFSSLGDAQKSMQDALTIEENSSLYMTPIKLLTLNKPVNLDIKIDYKYNISKNIGTIIQAADDIDAVKLGIEILHKLYGPDTRNYKAEAIIYVCKEQPDKVLCEKNNKACIGSIYNNLVVKSTNEDIPKTLRLGKYTFKAEKFSFSSDWYEHTLPVVLNEQKFVQAMLTYNVPVTDSQTFNIRAYLAKDKYRGGLKRLHSRLNAKALGKDKLIVYYVAVVSAGVYTDVSDIMYIRLRNAKHITSSITEMDLFDTYEDALMACKSEKQFDENTRIYNIMNFEYTYSE